MFLDAINFINMLIIVNVKNIISGYKYKSNRLQQHIIYNYIITSI